MLILHGRYHVNTLRVVPGLWQGSLDKRSHQDDAHSLLWKECNTFGSIYQAEQAAPQCDRSGQAGPYVLGHNQEHSDLCRRIWIQLKYVVHWCLCPRHHGWSEGIPFSAWLFANDLHLYISGTRPMLSSNKVLPLVEYFSEDHLLSKTTGFKHLDEELLYGTSKEDHFLSVPAAVEFVKHRQSKYHSIPRRSTLRLRVFWTASGHIWEKEDREGWNVRRKFRNAHVLHWDLCNLSTS